MKTDLPYKIFKHKLQNLIKNSIMLTQKYRVNETERVRNYI